MQFERKIINIFRSFIEKALIPQIKRMEGSLFQWNKFNALVSVENINYNELQMYVDCLNGPVQTLQSPERKDQFTYFKKRTNETGQNNLNDSIGFNPSKTFGGTRARVMFPLKGQNDEFQNKKEQFSPSNFKQSVKQDLRKINPINLLSGLERLSKVFSQVQAKIQSQIQVSNSGNYIRNQKQGFY